MALLYQRYKNLEETGFTQDNKNTKQLYFYSIARQAHI